jgi:hypothetical protein
MDLFTKENIYLDQYCFDSEKRKIVDIIAHANKTNFPKLPCEMWWMIRDYLTWDLRKRKTAILRIVRSVEIAVVCKYKLTDLKMRIVLQKYRDICQEEDRYSLKND